MTAEWVRVDLDDVDRYGADAAVVLGLIAYRCNLTGSWEASTEQIVTETRLTLSRVRTALQVLRDTGAVQATRADRFRALLTWSVSAGHTENQDSRITGIRIPANHEMQDSRISSYTEEELPLVVPTESKPKKRATRLPADFRPTEAHFALAASLGVDLRHEGPQFVDYHTAKGSTFKDWNAALRTWIRNAAKFSQERQPEPTRNASPASWAQPYTPGAEHVLPPQRPADWVAGW